LLVSLESSGGFAGLRLSSSMDTDELPAEQAGELMRALDAMAAEAPTGPPRTAQPHYRLTIHRPSGRQVIEMTEPQVPAAVRPLLAELMRRARAQS
jgi:hypothetical protein